MAFRSVLIVLVVGLVVAGLLSACAERLVSGSRSADYSVDSGTGGGKVWVDYRKFATIVETERLISDGIHDPANPALKSLQDPSEAMAAFPQDRKGGVNWVRALELGIIAPGSDLWNSEKQMPTIDMDIIFRDTSDMPWVKFPHLAHTQWLSCLSCHPKLYVPRRGANDPSMDEILAGESCGRCHGKVAFALWVCERCHSIPHKGSPKKWWDEKR